MPTLRFVERYSHPPTVVVAFFRQPANVIAVSPAELDIQFLEGPEVVTSGDRFVALAKRFGLSRRIETEVVCVEEMKIIERQVDGPFRSWQIERQFVVIDGGTELTEIITFEPPTGLMGMMMSAAVIERELTQAYANRAERVTRMLAGA